MMPGTPRNDIKSASGPTLREGTVILRHGPTLEHCVALRCTSLDAEGASAGQRLSLWSVPTVASASAREAEAIAAQEGAGRHPTSTPPESLAASPDVERCMTANTNQPNRGNQGNPAGASRTGAQDTTQQGQQSPGKQGQDREGNRFAAAGQGS